MSEIEKMKKWFCAFIPDSSLPEYTKFNISLELAQVAAFDTLKIKNHKNFFL